MQPNDLRRCILVSRLRPLSLEFAFEDIPYKLGEEVNCHIQIDPRTDVYVREARIDLVCQVNWTESYTVMVPASRPSHSGSRGGLMDSTYIPSMVSKQVSKDHKETYVHSSVSFLEDTNLQSGRITTYNTRLTIQSENPDNASRGTVKWGLVAVVNVARARDIHKRHKVKISLL